jgi:rhodanese-related sulfurtransferase
VGQGIDRERLRALMKSGVQLVEVLPAKEYEEEHLPGAISIPLTKLDRESTAVLDAPEPVVVYCWDSA